MAITPSRSLSLQTPTVFVVDSEPCVAESLARPLREDGLRVVSCGSVTQVARLLRKGQAGCVVLSVRISEGECYELGRDLLALDEVVPVLWLCRPCRRLATPRAQLLERPFESRQLVAAVRRVLAGQRLAEAV